MSKETMVRYKSAFAAARPAARKAKAEKGARGGELKAAARHGSASGGRATGRRFRHRPSGGVSMDPNDRRRAEGTRGV